MIEQYQLHASTYKVIATGTAEAIAQVIRGEAELIDNSTQYVEVCDVIGMPVEGNEALAGLFSELNVNVDAEKIPSIRCVRRTS